jgi:cell division protein FtsN
VKPNQDATPPATPAPVKPKQEAAIARSTGYSLQFGLFAIKENAVALSKKISLYEPVEIIEHGKSYRVLLKKNYLTKQEAEAMMKKLPFVAIIIPTKEAQH